MTINTSGVDMSAAHKLRWRYRQGIFSKTLVLQVSPPFGNCEGLTRGEAMQGYRNWRDATASDLSEYGVALPVMP